MRVKKISTQWHLLHGQGILDNAPRFGLKIRHEIVIKIRMNLPWIVYAGTVKFCKENHINPITRAWERWLTKHVEDLRCLRSFWLDDSMATVFWKEFYKTYQIKTHLTDLKTLIVSYQGKTQFSSRNHVQIETKKVHLPICWGNGTFISPYPPLPE